MANSNEHSLHPSIELIRLVAVILITFTHTRNNLESGISYFIIEKLPLYGTSILSIVSGYLYFLISRNKKNLFQKKIKSLAIPYLIANLIVIFLVLVATLVFKFDILNRLSINSSLITEGLFALTSPPINPPTYFIRDLFIIFSIIALFTQWEFKTLFVLIPYILFGTLILRLDVAFLFTIGIAFAAYKDKVSKPILVISLMIISLLVGYLNPSLLKFPVSLLIFILVVDLKFNFFKTGRYSYLLHLYHSPIMVVSFPILSLFLSNELILIISQILLAMILTFGLYRLTKKYKFLTILSGGR